jgi:hypothetical protein
MMIVLGGSGSAEAQAASCTEDDTPRPCTCESSVHHFSPQTLRALRTLKSIMVR